ncbi:sulfurtransferase [Chthonobacter albigriseus]|uniref:sulfurtransferase n=1 Tax=Chthonobacter albigriseus TaxID=1683161 RepID=UPI0015EE7BB0|nr:rhodanese-like domain-containing protein [Chthonobacter albigriseus]
MKTLLLTRRAFSGAIASLGLAVALAAAPVLVPVTHAAETAVDASRWVVDAAAARSLVEKGALVLDTRGADLKSAEPLDGAVAVIWQDFTKPDLPNKGQLLEDDAALSEKLRALGVSAEVPVIAVADTAKGWGEDGRIVWTLRTLGHKQAYLVDGGIAALTGPGPLAIKAPAVPGSFTVARTEAYEIKKEELRTEIGAANLVILDTREPREYAGETPYGETRGGHVPGAKHIFYKDLVGADGKILPKDELKARLASLGVKDDTQVVSYCTGGIRSGFVTAVLNDAGVKARNYAGSMWEWSASPEEQYPLETN